MKRYLLLIPLILIFIYSAIAQVTYKTSGYNQKLPAVDMDQYGNFVAVWQSYFHPGDENLYGIVGQRFDSTGNRLGSEFLINTTTALSQERPKVAVNGSGVFVVAWMSETGIDTLKRDIYVRIYDNQGNALTGEIKVNEQDTLDQTYPDVDIDSLGNFVVTWQSEQLDGSYDIYGQMFDNNGNKIGSNFLVNTYTNSDQKFPSIAIDGEGNFVITWQSFLQDGSQYGVYAQRYDKTGVKIGDEFKVNEYWESYQRAPRVAMNSQGIFVIVWQGANQDGSGYGVYVKGYNPDGSVRFNETLVNEYTENDQFYPDVAIDKSGNFVVTWGSQYQDGDGWGVYAKRYDSIGNVISGEFRVNSQTQYDQSDPAVAVKELGDFVVVWNSTDVNNYYDIFAQMYKMSPKFSSLPQINFDEDNNYKIPVSYYFQYVDDENDPDDSLSWQFFNGTYLTTQFQNDTLTIIPETNWSGTDSFMVVATDPNNLSDTTYQIVSVNPNRCESGGDDRDTGCKLEW